MGKHPCITLGKCRDLLSTKIKAKDSVEAIEESPIFPDLVADIITNTFDRILAKDCVKAMEEGPTFTDVDIATNIFIRLLTTDAAHPLSKIYPAIKKGRPIPDLPSDIITNILTRLPAKSIFQLWQSNPNDVLYQLTTDPYFKRTHLNQCPATPTIVAHSRMQSVDNKIKLFLFDGSSFNGNCKNIEAASLDLSSWNCGRPTILCGSYDGFLLFETIWDPAIFCIWNPITKEQVIVTSHVPSSWICGFYFHPSRKEYEVICIRTPSGEKIWDYQILGLRTKHRRSIGSYSYSPSRKRWPVFINGTLYWMVDSAVYREKNDVYPSLSDSILSFNIETEEFSTMEAIKPSNDSPLDRSYLEKEFQLFDLDGELGLFYPSASSEMAVIWVFNYSTKRWNKKHSISSSPVDKYWRFFREIGYIKTKGELIAYPRWNIYDEWYAYDLRLGTWKVIEWKRFEKDKYTTTIHTHSLVSLDAADSVMPVQW